MTSSTEPTQTLIAFLDANIVLEGKPMRELPWEEVAADGLIRVLIVPKAMEEIDAKKRDGRLGPHARAFNHLITPSVINGVPIILRESKPRVELQIAVCARIPWDDYDELDPKDGDSRIIAEALNVRNETFINRLFISHDIKPLAYARGRDLPVHKASDNWLRGPESSPKDKEIQRLKQQLAEFRKDEPTFDISIDISDIKPLVIYKVGELGRAEFYSLIEILKSQNPKRVIERRDLYGLISSIGVNQDYSYDERYNTYISKRIPAFAEKFSEKLELIFNQRLFAIHVTNAGKIRADHLVVSVKTSDGWINQRVVVASPKGPPAPVPKSDYIGGLGNLMREFSPLRVGRHEFETTLEARRSCNMEVSCEDFRSGQEYYFKGVIVPSSTSELLKITVALTAKNLRGEHTKTFSLEKQIVSIEPRELVDLTTLNLKQDYPTKKEIECLLEAEECDEYEWDENNDD